MSLEGIRVVELTHLIAGPFAGQLFADNGATVIKVEAPDGELSRHRDPVAIRDQGTVTAHFASMNRGKQSVTVDLKNPAGHDFFRSLVATADVVVSNMRPGALERLGIALPDLTAAYPQLIAVSITGFGVQDTVDGERDRAGLAIVAEAIGGLTNLTKDREHHPVWVGFALGDMMAGIYAYSSALSALLERARTGKGRFIDLALVETILPLTSIAMAREQLADAKLTASAAGNDFHGVPYGVYQAADGYVSIGANTDKLWSGVCAAMGRDDLAADPRYATFEGRSARFDEVNEIVDEWTSTLERDEIVRRLGVHDIPVAAVATSAEVQASRRYNARGMMVEVDDGVGGSLRLPADPALRTSVGYGPVPTLGEHTLRVAEALAGSTEQAAELAAAGAFGPADNLLSRARQGSTQ